MTLDDSIYNLLCFIEKRKVVSSVSIKREFTKLPYSDTEKILSACRQLGYIENIQIHGGYHQIGTFDSDNYQLTLLGRQFIERHKEKSRQKCLKVIGIIVTALLLPLAVNLIGAILSKRCNLP